MLVSNLRDYAQQFSTKEECELDNCFAQIQDYIRESFMKNGSHRRTFEFQIHRNMYTHSYLVLDFETQEVYLSHRDHGVSRQNYFCEQESQSKAWKYTMCLLVVKHWAEIRDTLEQTFKDDQSVSALCQSFSL